MQADELIAQASRQQTAARRKQNQRINPDVTTVYKFIVAYREAHDSQSPTIRAIMRLGFVSTATTNDRIKELIRLGKLWRDDDNNLRLDVENKPEEPANETNS